jgi:hypothetical protein
MKTKSFMLVLVCIGLLVTSATVFAESAETDKVISSLNTPEKVTKYLKGVFRYDMEEQRELLHRKPIPSPSKLIKTGKATCVTTANFARLCLLKAGYEVELFKLTNPHKKVPHVIAVVLIENKYNIIGDSRNLDIQGPFESIEELQTSYDKEAKWENVSKRVPTSFD